MPRKKKSVPSYLHHKPTNQARVRIDGKDIYLGKYDSAESHEAYRQILAEYQATGTARKSNPQCLTVQQIADEYLAHLTKQWTGKPRGKENIDRVNLWLGYLTEVFGSSRAEEFGPRKMIVIRQQVIEKGYVREKVNAVMQLIKRCFAWAVGMQEYLSGDQLHKIEAFPMLQSGESSAKESKDILPAQQESIDAVRKVVTPQIRDMIDLQLWTGMRSGEMCQMRIMDIDRSGVWKSPSGEMIPVPGVWTYEPKEHKSHRYGHRRIILFGPTAQGILASYLNNRPVEGFVFRPVDHVRQLLDMHAEARQTPRWKSHMEANEKKRLVGNGRRDGIRWDPKAYGKSIDYAFRKLKKQKIEVERFFPHQLRHSNATKVGAEFPPEVVRILLGHASLAVTKRYLVDDIRKAAEAMKKAG